MSGAPAAVGADADAQREAGAGAGAGAGAFGQDSALPIELSPELASRYRVVNTLGAGAMGVVYRAVQIELDREVAIKLPVLTAGESVDRFIREGRILAQLEHPNLVRVYDAGQDRKRPFIVFEFVRGQTLTAMAHGAALAPELAVGLAIQLLEGLGHAHAHGVLHRDVKSDNALVTAQGIVKLADFGLARSEHYSGGTCQGVLMGTPAFMAPEQAQGLVVDARADLYSAGVVLFELLTAQLPFEADSLADLLRMQISQPPPRLADVRPDAPQALDRVLERVLAKTPADRFPDAADLVAALRRAMGTRSLDITKLPPTVFAPRTGGESVAGATVDPESARERTIARADSFKRALGGAARGEVGTRDPRARGTIPGRQMESGKTVAAQASAGGKSSTGHQTRITGRTPQLGSISGQARPGVTATHRGWRRRLAGGMVTAMCILGAVVESRLRAPRPRGVLARMADSRSLAATHPTAVGGRSSPVAERRAALAATLTKDVEAAEVTSRRTLMQMDDVKAKARHCADRPDLSQLARELGARVKHLDTTFEESEKVFAKVLSTMPDCSDDATRVPMDELTLTARAAAGQVVVDICLARLRAVQDVLELKSPNREELVVGLLERVDNPRFTVKSARLYREFLCATGESLRSVVAAPQLATAGLGNALDWIVAVFRGTREVTADRDAQHVVVAATKKFENDLKGLSGPVGAALSRAVSGLEMWGSTGNPRATLVASLDALTKSLRGLGNSMAWTQSLANQATRIDARRPNK